MTREETIKGLKSLVEVRRKYCAMQTMKDEIECLDMAIRALEQQPCGDWYDVPSDEMTLEQARQAVKDLRKKLAEHLEQEPCEDATLKDIFCMGCEYKEQEPKTGHWIADVDRWGDIVTTVNGYRCDKCNTFNTDKDNYCPNCGAKMEEVEE